MSAAALQPEPSLSDRLGRILCGLRERLAVRAARDRAFAVILLVLWNRLSRSLARFAAIAARHRDGKLRTARELRRRTEPATPSPRHPPPRDPLPRQRGWLLRRASESVVYGEYLRLLLEDPEMAKLIEAAPQVRRVLRPLWRMLRLEPVPEALRPDRPPPSSPADPPLRRCGRSSPAPVPRPPRVGTSLARSYRGRSFNSA